MNGTIQISLVTHNAKDLDEVSSGLARMIRNSTLPVLQHHFNGVRSVLWLVRV